jgi:LacI family transcriptional regulator
MDAQHNVLFSYVTNTYRGPADLPKAVREANTSGAIFIQHLHPRMVEDIQRLGIPVVGIDHFPTMKTIDSLQIDNRHGALLATRHLLDLGHRSLAFLRASRQRPSIAERAAGFREALRERGLQSSGCFADAKELGFEASHARARELLTERDRPTAIFCANDDMASGVLRAAWELGVHVPRELSVVGFDDIAMSRRLLPPLTTVGVDKQRLGSQALERLLELIAGNGGEVRHESVPVRLVVRDSTALARTQVRRRPAR